MKTAFDPSPEFPMVCWDGERAGRQILETRFGKSPS